MKPNYKNWIPKGLIFSMYGISCVLLALCIIFGCIGFAKSYTWSIVLFAIMLVFTLGMFVYSGWYTYMYKAFDYNGKKKIMKVLAEGVTSYVDIKPGQKGIDIGCGSGALAIALAKKNSLATVIGLDRWGKEYASFNKLLCERNAEIEGVANVSFVQGDATKLPFEDESVDVLVSNYVYHNIPSKDRQAILLESLRIVKKGGEFAIHDIFSKSKYGDMNSFIKKLKDMGYESVELLDTTNGIFMTKSESRKLMLQDSRLLVGKK